MSNHHLFATTPEAVLRAESVLAAFHQGREGDIPAMLTTDQQGDTDPWQLMVALIAVADRLADYAAGVHAETTGTPAEPPALIREACRVVAQAVYESRAKQAGDDGGTDAA